MFTKTKTIKIKKDTLFTDFPVGAPYPKSGKYQDHLFDQYKLYVELADKISARRETANAFFLTVNTSLLSFVGYITSKDTGDYIWLLGIVGLLICYFWYRLLCSYRGLNTAKFLVVHEIEARLPLKPYDAEWEALGEGKDDKRYKPLTHIEQCVPWVFAILHGFVLLRTTPWDHLVSFVKTICSATT